ncbi:hypothetical protein E2562_033338 [Oryza meyeriana var. granulata]|uniref:Uncharacterized protein n=1 Tax=Oryza meyeriana var. granulata TaxID=110450 RepID=A0A6G1E5M8_9ORYZ|nr:hypothetical protein E2562_033338 [Oryza meyeriana var. granulata]
MYWRVEEGDKALAGPIQAEVAQTWRGGGVYVEGHVGRAGARERKPFVGSTRGRHERSRRWPVEGGVNGKSSVTSGY